MSQPDPFHGLTGDGALLLPANIEAEQALLGAILTNNKAFDRVPFLQPEMFASEPHRWLFRQIQRQMAEGINVSPVTLRNELVGSPQLEPVGGVAYVSKLLTSCVGIINAADYGWAIKDAWERRTILDLATQARSEVLTGEGLQTGDILHRLETGLLELAGSETKRTVWSGGDAASEAISEAESAFKSETGIIGASTGYRCLDGILGGFEQGTFNVLAGRPGMGKAQPLDAKVLRRDGTWAKIGDLRLGDELASVDGAPSRVVGIFPQGVKRIFRITMSDGRSTRACGEHLWEVCSSKFTAGKRILSTDKIADLLTKNRYQQRLSLPMVSGDYGEDKEILVDPWLLGAIIGNGCMAERKMSFSTADAATLHKVQACIGADSVRHDGAYDYRLCTSSDAGMKLRESIRSLGLMGRLSYDKFIPKNYLSASKYTRQRLLCGLLDTDGWVEKWGTVRYATSSERLAVDIRTLVRSLGGKCSIARKSPVYTYKGEKKCGAPSFVLNISHPEKSDFIDLKRKSRRCEEKKHYRAPSIQSIDEFGEAEAVCIAVTHPSRLYVTDDYIVTHNTGAALGIAVRSAVQSGLPTLYWSGEMSAKSLVRRLIAAWTGIPFNAIRTGYREMPARYSDGPTERVKLTQADFDAMIAAERAIHKLPLFICDQSAISVTGLQSVARGISRKHGKLGLMVVDYLDLMSPSSSRMEQTAKTTEISQGLLHTGKSLGVPMLVLQQLNREVDKRDDKRPTLSDLRNSGQIEQDADSITFVYREHYYLSKQIPERRERESDLEFLDRQQRWQDKMADLHNKGEFLIRKNRHGEGRDLMMRFDGPRTWFSDPSEREGAKPW